LKGELYVVATSSGHSVWELHDNIHCDTIGFSQALSAAKASLSTTASAGNVAVSKMAGLLGFEEQYLEDVLNGEHADLPSMTLRVKCAKALGCSAQLNLGWCDTKGYHMAGIGGLVAAGAHLEGNMFAGKHYDGRSIRVIIGILNFTFQYTIPIPEEKPLLALEDKPEMEELVIHLPRKLERSLTEMEDEETDDADSGWSSDRTVSESVVNG